MGRSFLSKLRRIFDRPTSALSAGTILKGVTCKGSLAPLLHNMIHLYKTCRLRVLYHNSILLLYPIIVLPARVLVHPSLLQYKGIRLYSDVIIRQEGREQIATLHYPRINESSFERAAAERESGAYSCKPETFILHPAMLKASRTKYKATRLTRNS